MTKADGATVDDAANLHLIMSMFNLIDFSSSYVDMTVYGFVLKMKQ